MYDFKRGNGRCKPPRHLTVKVCGERRGRIRSSRADDQQRVRRINFPKPLKVACIDSASPFIRFVEQIQFCPVSLSHCIRPDLGSVHSIRSNPTLFVDQTNQRVGRDEQQAHHPESSR